MNRKKSYGISVGTSSILVIIVILSLVCFAGLSVVSANADYRLSKKLAERTTTYYQASSAAHQDLALLDAKLQQIFTESDSESEYMDKIKESLSDSLTFNYVISDSQSLIVSVTPVYPENAEDALFTIDRFQVVTTNEPALDNSLSLLLGNLDTVYYGPVLAMKTITGRKRYNPVTCRYFLLGTVGGSFVYILQVFLLSFFINYQIVGLGTGTGNINCKYFIHKGLILCKYVEIWVTLNNFFVA